MLSLKIKTKHEFYPHNVYSTVYDRFQIEKLDKKTEIKHPNWKGSFKTIFADDMILCIRFCQIHHKTIAIDK